MTTIWKTTTMTSMCITLYDDDDDDEDEDYDDDAG